MDVLRNALSALCRERASAFFLAMMVTLLSTSQETISRLHIGDVLLVFDFLVAQQFTYHIEC